MAEVSFIAINAHLMSSVEVDHHSNDSEVESINNPQQSAQQSPRSLVPADSVLKIRSRVANEKQAKRVVVPAAPMPLIVGLLFYPW